MKKTIKILLIILILNYIIVLNSFATNNLKNETDELTNSSIYEEENSNEEIKSSANESNVITDEIIEESIKLETNTEKVMLIDNVWRMVKNGKVDYNYTGIGTNEYGTWYLEKGAVNFNYTGNKTIDGKTYVIQKSQVMTNLTKVMLINNVWRMVKNGIVDYNYTGIGTNESGTWYVEKGTVNFGFNSTYYEGDKANIIEGGKVVLNIPKNTTKIVFVNNVWRMVIDGKVDYNYDGIGTNESGTWYVEKGAVRFNYTGNKTIDGKTYIIQKSEAITKVVLIDNAWKMVVNGIVDYNYTGIGTNENGEWYVENGVVNFKFNSTYYKGDKAYIIEGSKVALVVPKNTTEVLEVNKIWRMIENGKINYDYDGIGTNKNGTWYVEKGAVRFNYTGNKTINGKTYVIQKNQVMTNLTKVMLINNVWRMVKNGIVDYNYTGIGTNEYGTWYVEKGAVNFGFNNTYYEGDKANIIEGGKVVLNIAKNTTKIVLVNNVWRMVVDGKVDYNYDGIGTNEYGTWYVKKGTINFNYTGGFKNPKDGKTYVIYKNEVMKNWNKVVLIDNVWRMAKNGIVDFKYTGIGSNENGTWYVEEGKVTFSYNNTYYEGDKAYIIEGSKVATVVSKNTTEVILINNVWRMVTNGKIDYKYNGVGSNNLGIWVLKNGYVQFGYTGHYVDPEGSEYTIRAGKAVEVLKNVRHPGIMWIDEPRADYSYGAKTIKIQGWTLAQDKGDIVQIYIDDRYIGEASRVAREDVFKAYPNQYGGRASTPYPGFYSEVHVSNLSRGVHTLRIVNVTSDKKTVIQSKERTFKLVRLASSRGIDVSKYQGDINWNEVKRSGVDFAIIRIGYYLASSNTTVKDEKFVRNYDECRRLGIAVGGYFYSYAFNAREGDIEADRCLSIMQGRHFDLPIFIDVEDDLQLGIDRNSLTDACVAFCDRMNRSGYASGVYANLKFLNNHLDRGRLERYNIWLAQWQVSSPTYSGRYDIWQYTDVGRVPGINGFVDMNYGYKKYF